MAFTSGTATSHTDLWSKLIAFLTANSTLVGAGQQWTSVWGSGNERVLRGPGLGGADGVLIGLKLVERPSLDEYEIRMAGMTGVLAGSTTYDGHVNTSPTHVLMFADSGAMSYWFVANGRRFIVVLKISTVFQTLYGGFFLPYSPPTDYAYPLFIGGSAGEIQTAGPTSWRSIDANHAHFPYSHNDPSVSTSQFRNPSGLMLSPQGEWLNVASTGVDTDVAMGPRYFFSGLGSTANTTGSTYGYNGIRERMRSGFAGEILLTPLTLVATDQTYGTLDGAHHVPGFEISAEDVVAIGGTNHLVVQNVFRTNLGDYWALALA